MRRVEWFGHLRRRLMRRRCRVRRRIAVVAFKPCRQLARELMEELGVEVEVGKMVSCGEVIWQEVKKETLHMIFNAKITKGTPALNPEQTTALEMVWLPVSGLSAKHLYPNVGPQIAAFCHEALHSGHIGVIDQPYVRS